MPTITLRRLRAELKSKLDQLEARLLCWSEIPDAQQGSTRSSQSAAPILSFERVASDRSAHKALSAQTGPHSAQPEDS